MIELQLHRVIVTVQLNFKCNKITYKILKIRPLPTRDADVLTRTIETESPSLVTPRAQELGSCLCFLPI